MRRKKKHQPSSSHSKEKDSNRKGGNNNQNINPSIRNAREVSAASRAPVGPTAEGSVHSDDDDDDDEYCKDSPPMTSVLSAVVKVPQKPALHSNIDGGIMKAHVDSGEHKDSIRKGKKHHRQNR
jgi:hypothetical protein